jgi:hypothetical protein
LSFARRAKHTMCTKDDPGPAIDYLFRLCVRASQRRKMEAQKFPGGMSETSNTGRKEVRPGLRDRHA